MGEVSPRAHLRKRWEFLRLGAGGASSSNHFLQDEDWKAISGLLDLSSRESDIARLLVMNHSEQDVAIRLNISVHTVHTHLGRMYRKLVVTSRCELIICLFVTYVQRVELSRLQLTAQDTSTVQMQPPAK